MNSMNVNGYTPTFSGKVGSRAGKKFVQIVTSDKFQNSKKNLLEIMDKSSDNHFFKNLSPTEKIEYCIREFLDFCMTKLK